MSLHKAFISVINEHPELFSTEDLEDLAKQKWSDDIDELGDRIYEWASTRKSIYEACLESLSERNDNRDRFIGFDKQNRQFNLINEEQINSYHTKLENIIFQSQPEQWAETQLNLGNLYFQKITGDRRENIEKAIACYKSALTIYTELNFPQQWTGVQRNLALAYCDRIYGDRAKNIQLAIKHSLSAIKIMDNISIDFPMSVDVYLPPEVSQQAALFASEQISIDKAKQVFTNTIAIYAVHLYLEAIQIESELESGNSWQAGQRTIFDLSDLVILNYGRIECRPIEPNASVMTLPSFTEPNCRGYIAVRLPELIQDSQTIPQITTVKLLGFVKTAEIPEGSENIALSSLHSLESLLDDICLIESWTELSQQEDPVVKALQQVLGEREEEFLDRLKQFSQTEDIDDRNDRALRFLLAGSISSGTRNKGGEEESSRNLPRGMEELYALVEQLWDKLGI